MICIFYFYDFSEPKNLAVFWDVVGFYLTIFFFHLFIVNDEKVFEFGAREKWRNGQVGEGSRKRKGKGKERERK